MTRIVEVERSDVTETIERDNAYVAQCRGCGRDIVLWFNGGELDSAVCCNLYYLLESPHIECVVYEARKPDPTS